MFFLKGKINTIMFSTVKKILIVFSPYNIFKKKRREHYNFYNQYLDEKDIKHDWELLTAEEKELYQKLHEEYMAIGHLLHQNLVTILKYLNASVIWRDLACLLNH